MSKKNNLKKRKNQHLAVLKNEKQKDKKRDAKFKSTQNKREKDRQKDLLKGLSLTKMSISTSNVTKVKRGESVKFTYNNKKIKIRKTEKKAITKAEKNNSTTTTTTSSMNVD
eukprot:TRINITY_DN2466_c0_g1_i1.p1 TRINITY_DN2466_c0_g1~~TRINITY_DN2466_c0_g1_i1.p1  ORF type:complete len:112 (+),score=27.76 TRINITY_DN2466_c0_g1_i1:139-474(+)